MILYDLLKFSLELKWKAISILHEKAKLILAQHGARAEAAHGEEPTRVLA